MKRVGLTWLALLALLALTCGGAYLDLGSGNLALALGIAAAKIALVGWLFMRLDLKHPLVRATAAVAAVIVAVLFGLSGVDYAHRDLAPAAWHSPHQLGAPLAR